MTYKNAVLSALKENPDINKAELAEQLGCSLQTVYRAAQKPAPKKTRAKRAWLNTLSRTTFAMYTLNEV